MNRISVGTLSSVVNTSSTVCETWPSTAATKRTLIDTCSFKNPRPFACTTTRHGVFPHGFPFTTTVAPGGSDSTINAYSPAFNAGTAGTDGPNFGDSGFLCATASAFAAGAGSGSDAGADATGVATFSKVGLSVSGA